MAKKEDIVVGLDIGSSKTCALICRMAGGSRLEVAGVGVSESKGWRRGNIVNLDAAVASIRQAVEEAETEARATVESAYVGIAGTHIRGVNAQGGLTLGPHRREITREDVDRVVQRAQGVSLPPDQQIVHVFPQEYLLDAQNGIHDPVGMVGRNLEVNVHLVTASAAALQNVVTAANRAGIYILGTVLEQMASSESNLQDDDRELGVALVDIGASTAEIILYEEGLLRHTAAIPVGGDHFTNDIAVGLRTPIPEAERLKCTWGLPVSGRPSFEALEVSGVGERPSRMVPYVTLAEILEPRATELLEMIQAEIARQGIEGQLGAGVVLTGGGAKLKGLIEMAEKILSWPVRLGIPGGIGKMGEALLDPIFSAVVGLVGYAHRMRRKQVVRQETLGEKFLGLFRARA